MHAHATPEEALRAASLRVTAPRLATLEAVQTAAHADTDTVIRVVREKLPAVSHQAVYDSLHALTRAGLVRRIQPHGMVARYESRVGDNHHHLVCRSCGLIVDVDCAVGSAPCAVPADDHGFAIDEAEFIFWGLCASCQAAPPESADLP
ncbi:transcriptional repressor [Microbacterium sp. MEC084]|jgi:Fur family ferric uptake transcriptional regulator|uniref:Fur family transcriptional regulator n=1 Tax=Microbacterium sp. MEC084 TaxID=1963027 RepID=UPI00106FDCF9|nr:Fur family transcriptional regulator [Microbacterium sp. MEC084]MCD1269595.1 transcriptional repressor [Microbacterium sp. MEC084]